MVLPQVYRAAELGYIDIDRVALTGQSYGGYCTAALVSSTNLFRAAVAVSGIYDLASNYGVLRPGDNFGVWWAEKGQGRMGQPPWSDLRRYLDNSPYFRADRIRTPLLIIHGRDDGACPVQRRRDDVQSALKRLGRTAQLAVYEGEGHVIYDWEPKQAIDAAERMLDFLRRHLGAKLVVSCSSLRSGAICESRNQGHARTWCVPAARRFAHRRSTRQRTRRPALVERGRPAVGAEGGVRDPTALPGTRGPTVGKGSSWNKPSRRASCLPAAMARQLIPRSPKGAKSRSS